MGKTAIEYPRGPGNFLVPPEDIFIIEDPKHPRYDPRVNLAIDDGMVQSILAEGVIENVICFKDGDRICTLSGLQRVKSAREANKIIAAKGGELVRVPVTIRKVRDDADAATVQAIANIRIPETPLQKAEKAARLSKYGRSNDQIAAAFGVTRGAVAMWLRLLDCIPSVQKAVDAGRITLSDADGVIVRLPQEKQQAALDKLLEKKASRTGPEERGAKVQKRPGKVTLRRLAADGAEGERNPLTARERSLLRWIVGDISRGDMLSAIPGVAPYLKK